MPPIKRIAYAKFQLRIRRLMQCSKLLTIITVLVFFGSRSQVLADYTIVQLREIERLTTENDWGALHAYIMSNPNLLQGSDELATELRSFVSDADNGLIEGFSAREDTRRGQVDLGQAPIY